MTSVVPRLRPGDVQRVSAELPGEILEEEAEVEDAPRPKTSGGSLTTATLPSKPADARTVSRVFITHGKNQRILDQVKKLVRYGKYEPIVATERETPEKSVPDKVIDDMRSCEAAVIHVGSEGPLKDADGKDVANINDNVLIEVGAALALYGRRFILLVEEGLKLPSNLQGLYECRYSGKELDGDATLKLLDGLAKFQVDDV